VELWKLRTKQTTYTQLIDVKDNYKQVLLLIGMNEAWTIGELQIQSHSSLYLLRQTRMFLKIRPFINRIPSYKLRKMKPKPMQHMFLKIRTVINRLPSYKLRNMKPKPMQHMFLKIRTVINRLASCKLRQMKPKPMHICFLR